MYVCALIVDVLGHPFGKVPSPKPFDADVEESQVILTDPCNPVGKNLLAGTLHTCTVHVAIYMYTDNVHVHVHTLYTIYCYVCMICVHLYVYIKHVYTYMYIV